MSSEIAANFPTRLTYEMLPEVHESLRRLIYLEGNISRREVDVSFEMPTARVVGSLVKPTLFFALIDLAENTELRNGAMPVERDFRTMKAVLRMPLRRIELKYLVTVVTSENSDDHLLLSRVLWTLLKHAEFPDSALPTSLKECGLGLVGRLAPQSVSPRSMETWSSFGGEPRTALLYMVTAPLDTNLEIPSQLVLSRQTRITNMPDAAAFPDSWPQDFGTVSIGGTVQTADGVAAPGVSIRIRDNASEPVTSDELGRFQLNGLRSGVTIDLIVSDPTGGSELARQITVPSDRYIISLD